MTQEIQPKHLGKFATAFGSFALASAAIASACGGGNGETKSVKTEPTLPPLPSPTREIPTPTPEPTPDARIVGMEPKIYTGQLASGLGTVRLALSPPKPDTSGQPTPPPIVGYPRFYDPGPLRVMGFEIHSTQPVFCSWATKGVDNKEYPDKTYNFIGSFGNVLGAGWWGMELAPDGSFSWSREQGEIVNQYLQGKVEGNTVSGRYWQVHNFNICRYCGDFSFKATIQ